MKRVAGGEQWPRVPGCRGVFEKPPKDGSGHDLASCDLASTGSITSNAHKGSMFIDMIIYTKLFINIQNINLQITYKVIVYTHTHTVQ